jgi:hypothetical protein
MIAMKWLPTLLIVSLGAIGLWRQEVARRDVRREIARLKPLAEEAAVLRARQHEPAAKEPPDPTEVERLRRDHQELLRLRSEIGSLRERGGLSEQTLQQRIQQARTETAAAERETELVSARKKAADISKQVHETLESYAHLIKDTERFSRIAPLNSWDDVRRALASSWPPDGKRPIERIQRFQQSLNHLVVEATTSSIPLTAFEFLPRSPAGTSNSTGNSTKPRLILREIQARPRPDGGWSRAYAFEGGKVLEATSDTGDFSEWETKAHN